MFAAMVWNLYGANWTMVAVFFYYATLEIAADFCQIHISGVNASGTNYPPMAVPAIISMTNGAVISAAR